MNKHTLLTNLAIAITSLSALPLMAQRGRNLLPDPTFAQGLAIVEPINNQPEHFTDTVEFFVPGGLPQWNLIQWKTRYPFDNRKKKETKDKITYTNPSKLVSLTRSGELTLEIKSSKDYLHPRKPDEFWPHLLIEQNFLGGFIHMKDYKNTSSTLAGMVGKCKTPEEIKAVFKERMNIDLKPYELEGVIAAINRTESDYMKISGSWNIQSVIASIMQSRTHIGFTSGNHTGEDVFLAVYNPNGQRPSGIITNTQLNQYMCRILGLQTSLRALSERDFSKAGDVFPGCTLSVNKDGSYPVLTVSGGGHTLVIPAWHSKYTLDGREISTPHPAVYMPDNDTFYVSTTLGKLMK